MLRTTEDQMRVTLTEKIEEWFDETWDTYAETPYVGSDVSQIMAEAAIAVLRVDRAT